MDADLSNSRWSAVKEKRVLQLENMKVDDLKILCRESGLKVTGRKAELVASLANELENKFRVTIDRFLGSEQKRRSIEDLTKMLESMDRIRNGRLQQQR